MLPDRVAEIVEEFADLPRKLRPVPTRSASRDLEAVIRKHHA
jgi:hypothetical protein